MSKRAEPGHAGVAMSQTGTLRRWNDARGFGFITPAAGGADVFVHIGAFARGTQPVIGETLRYEAGTGPDGRPRALRVHSPHARAQPASARVPRRSARHHRPRRSGVLGWVAVLAIAAYGISRFWPGAGPFVDEVTGAAPPERPHGQVGTNDPIPERDRMRVQDEERAFGVEHPYQCDGRTHCSQMTSCEEATFFLENCPGTKMDGNRDGVPCEMQWCG